MATETQNALLLIADIGGYTRFMNLHRMSLAHAQENTLRLLDAVIDSAPDLELSGLEGDAAFLYATDPTAEQITRSLAALATTMHAAFHTEQGKMEALSVCRCDACHQTGRLNVKLVAHYGEVVLTPRRGGTTLAGVDVILVHRMLKNSVPIDEYVLMTEAVHALAGPPFSDLAKPIDEELEGLGSERLYYVDMHAVAEPLPDPEAASWLERTTYNAEMTARILPYLVGLKKSEIGAEPQ
ncbi:MAG TPA: DUF2652 domain-containing protein [Gaiellaceae bacterium]|nr:DUF2652 domain-containing protein [Gaiellaceae bacterium]